MFWRLTSLSTSSPVESILDKENFSLEELLDEEEIIQECKALNSRLVNFLRDRAQVEQLLRYIVEEPPEDAESKRAFKFPFIACEIFTCEIDVILKTLVEEEELMDMLFSFLEPDRPHSALLAGYFSKVIICLMIRKTVPLMHYVQAHRDVLRQLVDLIGITSIMEVLVRLVGADDHVYPNFMDVMQWLSESDMLEMIVDKLSPSSLPEVSLIGEQVGARLISKAGSLTNLAKCPASTVQILGAEKALFRAMKTKTSTPKYGLIYHSTFIGRAGRQFKGRASRFLSNKLSIASRIDAFSDNPCNIFGQKMKQQCEDRLKYFETGEKPPKNVDVMHDALQESLVLQQQNESLNTSVKRKKSKKEKKSKKNKVEEKENGE